MSLSYPPEPSIEELRDRFEVREKSLYGIVEKENISDEIIAKNQVPSYLWSGENQWNGWKEELEKQGYSWQKFESDIKHITYLIDLWSKDKADWEKLIEKTKNILEV